MENEIKRLKKELDETKEALSKEHIKTSNLKRAIWDMLNHASIYFLVLNSDMNIVLANNSLSKALGINNERKLIGRCWGDFIPDDFKELISIAHTRLAFNQDPKYQDITNEIQSIDNKKILVKWFNVPINSNYNMIISFGMPKNKSVEHTHESIRSYYSDLLEKDKTMIDALRDSFITSSEKTCILKE